MKPEVPGMPLNKSFHSKSGEKTAINWKKENTTVLIYYFEWPQWCNVIAVENLSIKSGMWKFFIVETHKLKCHAKS